MLFSNHVHDTLYSLFPFDVGLKPPLSLDCYLPVVPLWWDTVCVAALRWWNWTLLVVPIQNKYSCLQLFQLAGFSCSGVSFFWLMVSVLSMTLCAPWKLAQYPIHQPAAHPSTGSFKRWSMAHNAVISSHSKLNFRSSCSHFSFLLPFLFPSLINSFFLVLCFEKTLILLNFSHMFSFRRVLLDCIMYFFFDFWICIGRVTPDFACCSMPGTKSIAL